MEMPAGVTNDSRSINPPNRLYELIGRFARPHKKDHNIDSTLYITKLIE
ncbi:hypothetical protein LSH36_428g02015 [Paralvinella palmiformis]|uniref:Uncharacterized protein n=1 Tax=Paralvinella palmiformis TaxID=53620 RepID=A0AAD9JCC8_9ANNE|nr:hypothetical protein LSH36_428g02015 [Paralvinella palmiformis]